MITQSPNSQVIDAGAVTLYVASFVQVLPNVAAVLSVLWFAIRVAETQTVQHMLGKYAWIKDKKDDNQ